MRRNFTLIIIFFAFSYVAEAQVWLELGLKGTMGITGFYNKNIIDDSQHDSQMGLGLSVGALAALNFGEFHGLNIEGLSATHHQSMTFRNAEGKNQTVNVEWRAMDYYLMYRWYRDNGAFFEIGPKFTTVIEAQQSLSTDWAEVSNNYQNYTSLAAGVGGFVTASKVLTIKTGLRAEYALTDFVSAQGMDAGYPAPYTSFSGYAETRPFRAGFYLEVTFGVGGIAKSVCGSRGVLLGTQYQ